MYVRKDRFKGFLEFQKPCTADRLTHSAGDKGDRVDEPPADGFLDQVPRRFDTESPLQLFRGLFRKPCETVDAEVIGKDEAEEVEGVALDVAAVQDELPMELHLFGCPDAEGPLDRHERCNPMDR